MLVENSIFDERTVVRQETVFSGEGRKMQGLKWLTLRQFNKLRLAQRCGKSIVMCDAVRNLDHRICKAMPASGS